MNKTIRKITQDNTNTPTQSRRILGRDIKIGAHIEYKKGEWGKIEKLEATLIDDEPIGWRIAHMCDGKTRAYLIDTVRYRISCYEAEQTVATQ